MESFSIDEVFLDMTGTIPDLPDPIATAHEIKDKIHAELGFTVNVGISTNKLLAKMASDFEKPDKVHTLFTRRNSGQNVAPSHPGSSVFWAKPPRKGCRISESIPSASLPGKRNPPSRLCLGKDRTSALPVCQRNRQFPGACPGRREQGLQRGENLQ